MLPRVGGRSNLDLIGGDRFHLLDHDHGVRIEGNRIARIDRERFDTDPQTTRLRIARSKGPSRLYGKTIHGRAMVMGDRPARPNGLSRDPLQAFHRRHEIRPAQACACVFLPKATCLLKGLHVQVNVAFRPFTHWENPPGGC